MVVTHEIGFARKVADEVAFMDSGIIAEHGHRRRSYGRRAMSGHARSWLALWTADPANKCGVPLNMIYRSDRSRIGVPQGRENPTAERILQDVCLRLEPAWVVEGADSDANDAEPRWT